MPGESSAPYAYEGLDRVFHEKARLGIVSSLAGRPDGLRFADLKALCGLTDGNLSRHLQVLEEAGYVAVQKSFNGRRPQTCCWLTDEGRARFSAYLDALQEVLREARRATAPDGFPLRPAPQAG
jgi:DNA-binding MarR family transcriptional regulator